MIGCFLLKCIMGVVVNFYPECFYVHSVVPSDFLLQDQIFFLPQLFIFSTNDSKCFVSIQTCESRNIVYRILTCGTRFAQIIAPNSATHITHFMTQYNLTVQMLVNDVFNFLLSDEFISIKTDFTETSISLFSCILTPSLK